MRQMFRAPGWLTPAILLLLVGVPTHRGQGQPPLNQGPMIRFSERQVNFGEISQESNKSHRFVFSNQGTEALRILNVESSCGCTAALATDSLLAPGETSSIEVTFNSRDFEGDQTKVVTVHTNDPAEPRIDLAVRAFVKPFIKVQTRTLELGRVKRGQAATVSTILEAEEGLEFRVKKVEGAEDLVTWSFDPAPGHPGDAWKVQATLRPDAPLGRFNKRVLVRTSHPNKAEEALAIQVLVYSYFVVEKTNQHFLSVKPGKPLKRIVPIEADGSQPYKILEAKSSASFIQADLQPKGAGYELTLTLQAPEKPGSFGEYVTLTTTDPGHPEIRIQVQWRVRP